MLRQNSLQLTIPIAVATGAAAIVGVAYLWYRHRRDEHKIPTKWKKVGKLEKIAIYPIKSCAYKEIPVAECTENGAKEIASNAGKRFLFQDRYDMSKEYSFKSRIKFLSAIILRVFGFQSFPHL